MSIRQRLEDAALLAAHGRSAGCLLSVCAAISATSRKRYPSRKVGDREAFTKFLGEEVRVVTAGAVINFNVACPGADPKRYPDGVMPLQDVMYDFVRCTLSHEGRLGANVEFEGGNNISVRIETDRIILGGGVIERLMLALRYAPENAAEFPETSSMPREVAAWHLFGQRRDAHTEYMAKRQSRLGAPEELAASDRAGES